MTINELIAALENVRAEHGNVNVLVDQLDHYGECDGLTTYVHVNWDDEENGVRVGCQDCE